MSNSTFQSLLMESGGSLEPGIPACVSDSYYDCGPTNDPYWASVVLLAHFDNNLTDVLGHTLTDTGVSFSTDSKYGSHSVDIGGAGGTFSGFQYVKTPTASLDFDLPGDFTIEGWVNTTEATSGRPRDIVRVKQDDGLGGEIEYLGMGYGGGVNISFQYPTSGTITVSASGSTSPTANTWQHWAFCRQGSAWRLYLDGVRVASATSSYVRPSAASYVYIGNSGTNDALAGKIDDVRITKGVCRYTDNFTPPTSAHPEALETTWTDGPRTVLLTHIPVSSTTITTTDGFDPSITASGRITYDLGNRRVIYPNSVGTDPITQVKTMRSRRSGKWYWELYIASYGNGGSSEWQSDSNAYGDWHAYFGASPTATWENPAGGSFISLSLGFTWGTGPHTYRHALDLNTGELWISVDGGAWVGGGDPELGTSPTIYGISRPGRPAVNISPDFGSGADMTIALKAEHMAYSVPDGFLPYGADTNEADDAAYVPSDVSCYQEKTLVLTEQTGASSLEARFGNYAIRVGSRGRNTGAGLRVRRHQDFNFSTADFTVEFYAYRISNDYTGILWYFDGTSGDSYVRVNTSGLIDYSFVVSPTYSGTNVAAFPVGQWNHVVIQRRSSAFEIYINGTRVVNQATTGNAISQSATYNLLCMSFGGAGVGSGSGSSTLVLDGYIDEVRITKNVARYTGDFSLDTLPYCGGEDPVIIPTSGTEYPSGEAATVHTGQITLANHYQPLVGNSTLVRQGGVGLTQYPLPSGNTATYTVTKTLNSSAATTTTVQGRLTWGTDGTFTFVNPENGIGTTTTWLSPTGAGASDEYELRLEIIDNPNNVVTPYSLPFEQYNEVVIDQIIPAYTDITLTEDEGSKTHTLQLQVDIKPKTGSAVAGQPGYVDSWLLTLNFLLTKPAIPVPVYPDFDSGTKVNSESGNVFTWYFNPNGTITSGAINGAQVGRWIDAFDDVAKASEYRLVVYSDPLPGGFQRVSPTTLIGANMGTPARVRHVNSGAVGSELYVGFTLRIYPLPTNPRYSEANYFGQYTFTMVIPQISGL